MLLYQQFKIHSEDTKRMRKAVDELKMKKVKDNE